jgi:hypothetical protein
MSLVPKQQTRIKKLMQHRLDIGYFQHPRLPVTNSITIGTVEMATGHFSSSKCIQRKQFAQKSDRSQIL